MSRVVSKIELVVGGLCCITTGVLIWNALTVYIKRQEKEQSDRRTDQKSLSAYFQLIRRYPGAMLGNQSQDGYRIVTDPKEIAEIQKIQAERLAKRYAELAPKGLPVGLQKRANRESRVGVIASDGFWVFVRDAVVAPSGLKHTYNRLIERSALGGAVGAAILPIVIAPDGSERFACVLIARHATRELELEAPRGIRNAGETIACTALRELAEEIGAEAQSKELVPLGEVVANSGVSGHPIKLFEVKIHLNGQSHPEDSEAIKKVVLLTHSELTIAINAGSITLWKDSQNETTAKVRDACLFSLWLKHNLGGVEWSSPADQ